MEGVSQERSTDPLSTLGDWSRLHLWQGEDGQRGSRGTPELLGLKRTLTGLGAAPRGAVAKFWLPNPCPITLHLPVEASLPKALPLPGFPGGPGDKIPHFHCRGCGFDLWRTEIPHASWHSQKKNFKPALFKCMVAPYWQLTPWDPSPSSVH